jgi:hypothetical protein
VSEENKPSAEEAKPSDEEAKPSAEETPAPAKADGFNITALLAECAGGIVVGLLCSQIGGRIGAVIGATSTNPFGDLIGAIIGTFIAYIFGATLGIVLVGYYLKQGGSAWRASLGSILGGSLVVFLAEPLRLNRSTTLLSYSIFFGVLLLALLGYNWQRLRAPKPTNQPVEEANASE